MMKNASILDKIQFTEQTRGKCNKNVILSFTKRTKNFVTLNCGFWQEWSVSKLVQARAAMRTSEQKVKAAAYLFNASEVTSRSSRQNTRQIQGLNYRLRIKPGVTVSRTVPSLIVRANLRTDKAKRVRIASRLSRQEQCSVGDTLRAWSKFKTGQNFLKNVVNLEIRERVKCKEILHSLRSLRIVCVKQFVDKNLQIVL